MSDPVLPKRLIVYSQQKRMPSPYGKVSGDARLLIALRHSGMADNLTICRIMSVSPAMLSAFWRRIRIHRFASRILILGLPAMYGEPLPDGFSLRCPSCQSLITWIPCVRCCEHKSEFVDLCDTRELAVCGQPTAHLPGSLAKIDVMRTRIENNTSAFCPNDAVIPD